MRENKNGFCFPSEAMVLAWIPWLAAIWLNQGVEASFDKEPDRRGRNQPDARGFDPALRLA
ncbi:MAG TPA: hypothetical protein VK308_10670 [Pyrinomonadaceae bacterium]|nr:hypothetical protein [Pyrinomonadaceae bacterium]